MKSWVVETDVTISLRMYVRANTEEEAQERAKHDIWSETMWHVQRGACVGIDIVDTYEDED